VVTWFTRKRETAEAAPATVEETDPLTALLAASHLPVADVDEQFGAVPAGVRATVDEHTLVVVVENLHPPRAHDRALAFGLAEARGRRLAIFLPAEDETVVLATRSRTALLRKAPIDLYTYDGTRAVVHPPLSERMLRSGAGESDGLERAEEYRVPARLAATAAPIEAWANHERNLTPKHLKSARVWVCEGQRVLSLRATRSGLKVVAGVRDDSLPDPEPLTLTLTGATPAARVDEIIVRVEAAIARRRAERAPGYREYRIAATLERVGRATDWGDGPVWRQVRGMRPGGGHARVPFVRIDSQNRLHVIEVAHHRTGLLGIRALDSWIWATENRVALAEHLGVPFVSSVVLDVVVAVGPGTPGLGSPSDDGPARDVERSTGPLRTPSVVGTRPDGTTDLADDDVAEDADGAEDDEAEEDEDDLGETSLAAVPAPVLAQLGALSETVVWEAHELSAWDTEHPVLRTTVRSGVPVASEHVPLMPPSLTAVQDFLQLVTPVSAASPAPVAPGRAAPALSRPGPRNPSDAAHRGSTVSTHGPADPEAPGPAAVNPATPISTPSAPPSATLLSADEPGHEPRPGAAATMAR
jgi:hypothetical protein